MEWQFRDIRDTDKCLKHELGQFKIFFVNRGARQKLLTS